MDDLLWGSDSVEQAIKLREEIHNLLLTANFKLRKYQSNDNHFLDHIEQELVEKETDRYVEKCVAVAVLGMIWTTQKDEFRIKIPENLKEFHRSQVKFTKRLMLSTLACVFDPLGLLAPVIIRGKLMLQEVWREKKDWNDEVSPTLAEQFSKYMSEMPKLEEFAVSRRYSTVGNGEKKLIAFCNASEKAYCVVFYLQVSAGNGVSCSLVFSKTRVAPIRALSIPRLELQAALLLAESASRVAQAIGVKVNEIVAFSDSQVVLAWLQQPSKKWTAFVSVRVSRIVSILPPSCWHYVDTKNNPADYGTRGLSVASFLKLDLWINGPGFLLSPDFQNFMFRPFCLDTDQELKAPTTNDCIFTGVLVKADCVEFINNFSLFLKLKRTIARILRLANRKAYSDVLLSSVELARSELALIRLIQKSVFSREYSHLLQGQAVSTRSALRSYLPFLDENGIIRVRGRIQNAQLSYDKINPIILPVKCHFTTLMVRHLHLLYYHAGKQFLVSFLSAKFKFIGGLPRMVKAGIRACVVCVRYHGRAVQQVFGDLPLQRTAVSVPFAAAGVDFAGPFWCRPLLLRSKVRFKVYAAILVCFATKAIHIEVAIALSAESFLAALQRFIARRGLPHTIWSDNGTNFQSAAKYVAANEGLALNNSSIQDFAANRGIAWHFNPPRAPHRGGLWEAAVKSAKHHMIRAIGEQVLDYERYVTLFATIEAILNSRPICASQINAGSFALTPAHFLIGRPMVELPQPELSPVKLSQRFEHIRKLTASFWHVWKRDYLNQLQQRSKWFRPSPNLKIDDVVLLKSDLDSPTNWRMGRVVEVFPDSLGSVRTVSVVDAAGSVKRRDVRHLVLLPTED